MRQAKTLPTAHGVTSDLETSGKRNLFIVDAMAPMIWRGMVVMPRDAAEKLIASLKQQPMQSFGKGRTVRGMGVLWAQIMESMPEAWSGPSLALCLDGVDTTKGGSVQRLPSVSQIRKLQSKLREAEKQTGDAKSTKPAEDYLDGQLKRTSRIWKDCEDSAPAIEKRPDLLIKSALMIRRNVS